MIAKKRPNCLSSPFNHSISTHSPCANPPPSSWSAALTKLASSTPSPNSSPVTTETSSSSTNTSNAPIIPSFFGLNGNLPSSPFPARIYLLSLKRIFSPNIPCVGSSTSPMKSRVWPSLPPNLLTVSTISSLDIFRTSGLLKSPPLFRIIAPMKNSPISTASRFTTLK